jgi:hypothetical protein
MALSADLWLGTAHGLKDDDATRPHHPPVFRGQG